MEYINREHLELKEKLKNQEDKGELQCTDCGGSPKSEPIGFDNDPIHVALCDTCKDWSDFMYEKDAREEEESCLEK